MANPARGYDDPQKPVGNQPPADHPPVEDVDPVRNPVRQERGMGTSAIIAAVVLVLAVIAYFVFGPSSTQTPTTANPPAATEPATPAPTAPSTSTPSTPEAPSATQPAAPTEPANPAPAQ